MLKKTKQNMIKREKQNKTDGGFVEKWYRPNAQVLAFPKWTWSNSRPSCLGSLWLYQRRFHSRLSEATDRVPLPGSLPSFHHVHLQLSQCFYYEITLLHSHIPHTTPHSHKGEQKSGKKKLRGSLWRHHINLLRFMLNSLGTFHRKLLQNSLATAKASKYFLFVHNKNKNTIRKTKTEDCDK